MVGSCAEAEEVDTRLAGRPISVSVRITHMGLPASRVSTSSASAQLPTNEVRLYVR